MAAMIELDNAEWTSIEDLFDPPGRRGRAARYPRREVVEAILFLARTGCQWRYLPDRYPPWSAVWQQWRRWRERGVWAIAMARLATRIRVGRGRAPSPSMVMIDAQTVRGGRSGPTFHSAGGRGGRTIGTKRTILIDILGLPFAVRADPAKPHDVSVGRDFLDQHLGEFPRLAAVVADRGYRGLAALAGRNNLALDITEGQGRVHAHRSALARGDRVCPTWPLAPPVALLRGHRGERSRVARGRGSLLPVRPPPGGTSVSRGRDARTCVDRVGEDPPYSRATITLVPS
jgi:transposase